MRRNFILGYTNEDKIKEFKTQKEAFNNSCEWVTIKAETFEEAKTNFWKKMWEWEDSR